jgi:quaternary ammonium compound-resistance protein SugE
MKRGRTDRRSVSFFLAQFIPEEIETMSDWIYLFIAGLFEVCFTTSLKLTENFTRFWPTFFFGVFTIASFCFLNKALTSIPLGVAYAVWTGIGAAGTLFVSLYFFEEMISPLRLAFLILLIASIVGLKFAP